MPARRLALLTSLSVMLLLLAWPVAAQAQSWKVKDARGHTRGSVVTTGTRTADILDLSGSRPGDMGFVSSADESGMPAFWFLRRWLSDTNYTADKIPPVRSGACYLLSGYHLSKVGRAVRTSSGWVVSRRVHGAWRRVGSTPRSCPGPYAMGAVRMLCW